jgi:hypothetical protein
VLEAEVSDLEKELALRGEMEAALKETLRELERAAARQQTGTQQVRHMRPLTHIGFERPTVFCVPIPGGPGQHQFSRRVY